MTERRFQEGLRIRRDVLGSEHVDASLSRADDFTRPLQELITEFCWGAVWARPGLDRKTRSLLNLAMLTALNRPHEVKLHVRGALNNGCTSEEIREVLLQAAVYCGIPAAVDSFRVAQEVLREQRSGEPLP
jgi:4-carboxymuconolactone decarboxylase